MYLKHERNTYMYFDVFETQRTRPAGRGLDSRAELVYLRPDSFTPRRRRPHALHQTADNKQTSSSTATRGHAHVLGKMCRTRAGRRTWRSGSRTKTVTPLGRRGGTDRARSRERGGGVTYGCLYPPTYVFYVFLMYLKKT